MGQRNMANRVSYVIDAAGHVAFVHEGSDPEAHVVQTLKAVELLQKKPR
jgi:peroxiredoxin